MTNPEVTGDQLLAYADRLEAIENVVGLDIAIQLGDMGKLVAEAKLATEEWAAFDWSYGFSPRSAQEIGERMSDAIRALAIIPDLTGEAWRALSDRDRPALKGGDR